ncbi:hypothetical protein Oweho_2238 [Owenweeksia hongkongensis DSM 17368]|uniref:Uncharacterized protein n=1 Tax=Owenweeksia hongkongensis (strain DSM 17368 / CIP 108786 / JCM 12287 / NRRL B-23963 / UST20020801) TaxID=926562 RepID=G8R4T8_OWEHD|nr:hypothetical protein [Owenweeksia hongkongensis]AEV33212.1 hypothetical protein Oweho_2238 [Owenweeksia hongkongensis DSM 17368]
MQKLYYTVLLAALTASLNAQLIVGVPDNKVMNGKDINPETMLLFKTTKTVFFYSEKDAPYYEEYGSKIKKNWTINQLILAPLSEANEYYKSPEEYSFLGYNMNTVVKTMDNGAPYVAAVRIYLDLITHNLDGESEIITRLVLGPDIKDLIYLYRNYLDDPTIETNFWKGDKLSSKSKNDLALSSNYIFTKAEFTNLYPGTLSIYLKQISELLEDEQTCGVLEKPETESLAKLATSTLVIPEGILTDYSRWTQQFSERDEEDFFKHYHYDYEIRSMEEINNMILEGKNAEGRYILVPAISNTDQYMNVYSPSGEWIYKNMDVFDRDYSSKDFKKLSKAIKKAAKG